EGAVGGVYGWDFYHAETLGDGDGGFVAAVHVGADAPDRVRVAQVFAHRGHRFDGVAAAAAIGKHDVTDHRRIVAHDRRLKRAHERSRRAFEADPVFERHGFGHFRGRW